MPATITAKVQFVGLITAATSNAACATVAPASVPATKPPGSSVCVATFTVTPMDLDGSHQTRLTNNGDIDADPTFSRDGAKIAFNTTRDGNAEIYVMNADGSNPIRVTNNPAADVEPAYSLDGARIAFRAERDGNREIYLMDSDGGNQSRLTNNSATDVEPSFGP